jgi:hypothetical protein
MYFRDLNYFSYLALAAGFVILSFLIYSAIDRKKLRALPCFIIFSSINFIVCISTFFMLSLSDARTAAIFAMILAAALFLSPAAFICYMINILDAELSKTNKYLRLLFYSPAVIITAIVLGTGSISVTDGKFGYMLYCPNLMIVDTFYFTTMYLVIIAIISYEIHKNRKNRINPRPAALLLAGALSYFVTAIIYYSIYMTGLHYKLPIQFIQLFLLYIFAALVILYTRKPKIG